MLLVSFATSAAIAQNLITRGLVTDPSGAAIADAQITLTNIESHAAQHAATNQAGQYVLTLPTGRYELTVKAAGFALYQQSQITIIASGNPNLNVELRLESASQTVTVKADSEGLMQAPSVGKTGTMLEEMPQSVQIIGRDLFHSQGDLELKESLRNSSGVIQGGSDGFGFGDRFQIRGLEARIYNDGFSDGDERNGIPHSLNGVERIEILEGPGSALFGSGPPGGTINMVHFAPSATRSFGGAFQAGSFGLFSGSGYATGPTGVEGLDYRVDGFAQHEDGFRSLTQR